MTGAPDSSFPADYAGARTAFLEAAHAASARVTHHLHPLPGPNGQELAADVAEIGAATADRALFLCSGTHGVEGFAGSALQTGLIAEGWLEPLPEGVKLVLVHAINPYGFAFLRRFNEDNIDLNRNFLEPGEIPPENPGYDALARWLAPRSLSPASDLATLGRLLIHVAGHGLAATRKAVTGGQYRHPDGLFYGGTERSWSAHTLQAILERHGAGLSRAIFLDVHTGLGPRAAAEIISNSPAGSDQYARARAIWGDRVKSTKTGDSVSADLAGTLKLAVNRMLGGTEMTAVSIEYGTVPAWVALRALRAENWLYRHPEAAPRRADRIRKGLVAAFNPGDEAWRAAVLREGRSALAAARTWLADRGGGA